MFGTAEELATPEIYKELVLQVYRPARYELAKVMVALYDRGIPFHSPFLRPETGAELDVAAGKLIDIRPGRMIDEPTWHCHRAMLARGDDVVYVHAPTWTCCRNSEIEEPKGWLPSFADEGYPFFIPPNFTHDLDELLDVWQDEWDVEPGSIDRLAEVS